MRGVIFGIAAVVASSGCANEPAPVVPGAATPTIVPASGTARQIPGFFSAFSWQFHAYTSPILTQPYDPSQCYTIPEVPCLNDAVYRQQWNNVWDWGPAAAWSATHPGHLYIIGDAIHRPDVYGGIYVDDPAGYARDYCTFVRKVRAADPTSAFTPSLMEPSASEAWLNDVSSGLLAEFQAGRCSTNPVAEWEFNFYPDFSLGLAGFKEFVDRRAAWAASQPAPIAAPSVLGAWVVGWSDDRATGIERRPGEDVPNDDPAYLERLREVKAWLFAHERIVHARYLFYEPWPTEKPEPHPLTNSDGTLNATGRVYAEVTGRIAGPKVVGPQSSCSWVAETTGGPPPYSFKWFANGRQVASQPAITVVRPDSAFTLELIVSDAGGGHNAARLDVTVRSDAVPCP